MTAQNFLFGTPTEDDFLVTSHSKLPPPCRKAIDSTRGPYGITSVLKQANQAWHSQHHDPNSASWFSNTYHTPTSKRWAQFILGLTTAKTYIRQPLPRCLRFHPIKNLICFYTPTYDNSRRLLTQYQAFLCRHSRGMREISI
eukprot:scaffold188658_cov33-Attheya_sp.AAC.1